MTPPDTGGASSSADGSFDTLLDTFLDDLTANIDGEPISVDDSQDVMPLVSKSAPTTKGTTKPKAKAKAKGKATPTPDTTRDNIINFFTGPKHKSKAKAKSGTAKAKSMPTSGASGTDHAPPLSGTPLPPPAKTTAPVQSDATTDDTPTPVAKPPSQPSTIATATTLAATGKAPGIALVAPVIAPPPTADPPSQIAMMPAAVPPVEVCHRWPLVYTLAITHTRCMFQATPSLLHVCKKRTRR